MNDPFSYSIDPVSVNPLQRSLSGVSSQIEKNLQNMPKTLKSIYDTNAGGGMDPLTGALVSGGIQALGSLFGAGARRRQQSFENRMQEEALNLQRQRLGMEQKRYADEMAQMRARSEFMRPVVDEYRGGTGRFAPSQRQPTNPQGYRAAQPSTSGEDYLRRARGMNQGGGM